MGLFGVKMGWESLKMGILGAQIGGGTKIGLF